MFCRHCGAQLRNDSRFCSNCGSPIDNSSPQRRNYTIPATKGSSPHYRRGSYASTAPVKKKKSRIGFIILCVFLGLIALGVLGSILPDDGEDTAAVSESYIAAAEPSPAKELVEEAAAPAVETSVPELGESKENPFVLTATELAAEIDADIDAAKEKYNGKWMQITGEISDTSDGGIIYGYYVYGESSLTGYRGLRIICWCEDGPYSGSVLGDTQTFLGQMREVTLVNATEIGDCEIVTQ